MEPVNPPIWEMFLTFGLSVAGWFLRMLWDQLKDLQKRVDIHHSEIADKYVRKDDFRDIMREIRETCAKIFDKLDSKADK
jgi:hypothetical protein